MAIRNTPDAKTERLISLAMTLLAARRPLTKEQIRRVVGGYVGTESDEAFEKMFERDKDDLREMGLPLVTRSLDAFHDDEFGYQIERGSYALPEISFRPDELAVVGLAGRAWEHTRMAQDAVGALTKLRSVAGQEDAEAFAGLEPRLRVREAAFDPLKDAVLDRRAVVFDYRSGGVGQVRTRHLQPWRLLSYKDRWYVTGFDLDREEPRVFRLSRITSAVQLVGETGAYEVPPEHDARAMITAVFDTADPSQTGTARLRVRPGRATTLRRHATLTAEATGEPTSPGTAGDWDEIEIPLGVYPSLADEVTALGPDVVVLSPPDLREAVIARLTAALGGQAATEESR